MRKLERFNPTIHQQGWADMAESEHGDYVEYSEMMRLLAEKDKEIAHLTAELSQANKLGLELQKAIAEKDNELERHRKRVILCCHCGMAFGQEDGEKADDALRRAFEHERQCPRNPMVQEIAEKDAKIERLLDYKTRTMFAEADNQRLREALERITREPHATTHAGMIDAFDKVIQQALAATGQPITSDNAPIMVGNGESTNDKKPAQGGKDE